MDELSPSQMSPQQQEEESHNETDETETALGLAAAVNSSSNVPPPALLQILSDLIPPNFSADSVQNNDGIAAVSDDQQLLDQEIYLQISQFLDEFRASSASEIQPVVETIEPSQPAIPTPSNFEKNLPRFYKTSGGATILLPSYQTPAHEQSMPTTEPPTPDETHEAQVEASTESQPNTTLSPSSHTPQITSLLNQLRNPTVTPPNPLSNLNNIPNIFTSPLSYTLDARFTNNHESLVSHETALEILSNRNVLDLSQREEIKMVVDILSEKSLLFMHSVGNNE
ncbi:hypothetical protein HK098_002106, partial [Nowakowskiella sp. JEL0407]